MSPSRPPQAPATRPWYLVLALVAGWLYGAKCASDGWQTLSYYTGERADVSVLADAVSDPAAREKVLDAGQRWLTARDAAKPRELPFGAASLVLGGAMILFAARSLAGREGARSALVQVVTVHAGVVVAAYFAMHDVTLAEMELARRWLVAGLHASPSPPPIDPERVAAAFARAWPPFMTALQTATSGLIVLALTRPRVRAFFAAASATFGEG